MKEDRFARQRALPEIGDAGQRRLGEARVLVAGCGALGSNVAEVLARAGIGRILLVDHDRVELSNLQRQALMTEKDIGYPKASVVSAALQRIDSDLDVEHRVTRIDATNAESLVADLDIVLDGLDNMPSRYVINDACVKRGIPWVFAAVAGTYGVTLPIRPGIGPCFRCLFPDPPPDEAVLTAQNAGILNAIPRAIVAVQTTEAIKVLLGAAGDSVRLTTIDLWDETYATQPIMRSEACPCCGERRFDFIAS